MGVLTGMADVAYRVLARPALFTMSPDSAHAATIRFLAVLDRFPVLAQSMRRATIDQPTTVGGVTLPSPVIVAAGLVKGQGFDGEHAAQAAARGRNIIPGWRSVPLLCGPVEIGSFTRYPRLGNPRPVLWRDVAARSTQNRVGLKNPGAAAAAEFLCKHKPPGVFGLSVATSPGEHDSSVQARHVGESIYLFVRAGVRPAWFTVNLSCPNTDDDPQATQTESLASEVTAAAVNAADGVPVWVKIGPDLSDFQYHALIDVFDRAGIRAVVATNTLGVAVAGIAESAGLGGERLFERALSVVLKLFALRERHGYSFDIVGCGGVMDGNGMRAYTDAGAGAVQVWSALVFRGPQAPAAIAQEYAALIGKQI